MTGTPSPHVDMDPTLFAVREVRDEVLARAKSVPVGLTEGRAAREAAGLVTDWVWGEWETLHESLFCGVPVRLVRHPGSGLFAAVYWRSSDAIAGDLQPDMGALVSGHRMVGLPTPNVEDAVSPAVADVLRHTHHTPIAVTLVGLLEACLVSQPNMLLPAIAHVVDACGRRLRQEPVLDAVQAACLAEVEGIEFLLAMDAFDGLSVYVRAVESAYATERLDALTSAALDEYLHGSDVRQFHAFLGQESEPCWACHLSEASVVFRHEFGVDLDITDGRLEMGTHWDGASDQPTAVALDALAVCVGALGAMHFDSSPLDFLGYEPGAAVAWFPSPARMLHVLMADEEARRAIVDPENPRLSGQGGESGSVPWAGEPFDHPDTVIAAHGGPAATDACDAAGFGTGWERLTGRVGAVSGWRAYGLSDRSFDQVVDLGFDGWIRAEEQVVSGEDGTEVRVVYWVFPHTSPDCEAMSVQEWQATAPETIAIAVSVQPMGEVVSDEEWNRMSFTDRLTLVRRYLAHNMVSGENLMQGIPLLPGQPVLPGQQWSKADREARLGGAAEEMVADLMETLQHIARPTNPPSGPPCGWSSSSGPPAGAPAGAFTGPTLDAVEASIRDFLIRLGSVESSRQPSRAT